MKSINHLCQISLFFGLVLFLVACKKGIQDIPKVQQTMELAPSSDSIALNADSLTQNIITFNWKPARTLPDDYLVSYTTSLDVVGDNFGTGTAIFNYEDDNVFSRSFTSEQLQNWANEKWGIPTNKSFTIEFRVVAQWQGGGTFQAPEVRTVSVKVTPIKTVVFDADKIFLEGSAVGQNRIEMPKTLENLNQYAYVLNLQPGELKIPVEYEGATNYIVTADGSDQINDGNPVGIKMRENAFFWKIENAGEYRVVVNMEKATVTLYSPATALMPKEVSWTGDAPYTTTISDLWMQGSINGYGTPIKMDCTVSLADPQILVYTGGKVGTTKFIVYGGNDNNKNLAYAFSAPTTADGKAQTLSLTLGKVSELGGGTLSANRNSYYTIPATTNVLILDLRNMTILAQNR